MWFVNKLAKAAIPFRFDSFPVNILRLARRLQLFFKRQYFLAEMQGWQTLKIGKIMPLWLT